MSKLDIQLDSAIRKFLIGLKSLRRKKVNKNTDLTLEEVKCLQRIRKQRLLLFLVHPDMKEPEKGYIPSRLEIEMCAIVLHDELGEGKIEYDSFISKVVALN